jgi:DNA-binding transcriptional ArsR family regulator
MREQAKQIAQLLAVLANQSRLLILCELMERPMTVGQIAETVPAITRSALSQHLSLLKAHRIVDATKSGQFVTYTIVDHRVDEIIETLKKYYCP